MLVWGRVYVTIFNDVTPHTFFFGSSEIIIRWLAIVLAVGWQTASVFQRENLGIFTNLRKKMETFSGWWVEPTHLKKYARQNGNLSSPSFGVKIKKIFELPPSSFRNNLWLFFPGLNYRVSSKEEKCQQVWLPRCFIFQHFSVSKWPLGGEKKTPRPPPLTPGNKGAL